MGHYINEFVYSRIAPNFLAEIKKLNPKVDGKRVRYHHQHTTRDFGHPVLKDHLNGLIALGRVSNNVWDLFK